MPRPPADQRRPVLWVALQSPRRSCADTAARQRPLSVFDIDWQPFKHTSGNNPANEGRLTTIEKSQTFHRFLVGL